MNISIVTLSFGIFFAGITSLQAMELQEEPRTVQTIAPAPANAEEIKDFATFITGYIQKNLQEKKEISYGFKNTKKIENLLAKAFPDKASPRYLFASGVLKISCPNDKQPEADFQRAISLGHPKAQEIQDYLDNIPSFTKAEPIPLKPWDINLERDWVDDTPEKFKYVRKERGDFTYDEIIAIKVKMWGVVLEDLQAFLNTSNE